jgi:hypothetical protein
VAIDIALEVGMNTDEYAITEGKGNCVLQESLRRTWWELYILSIMFAALNQLTEIRLWTLDSSALLPCEDFTYLNERVCYGIIFSLQTYG